MVKVNREAYVPLLPYDLGYEETILQLIKSLDCLDKVAERVYEHVRGKIIAQKTEIVKLDDQLNCVADKVRRLSNIKKTVQVYSSSKYPATNCQKDFEYHYNFDVKSDIVENIRVDHQICTSRNPSDKLKFYSSVDKDKKNPINRETAIKIKGLGDLPDDIKYLNSLLLFNSNDNLYKNYVHSNPYKVSVTTDKEVEAVVSINEPAFTLPLDDTDSQFNFSYTPLYEEVPTIDVPADLPDLPGIAGDISCFKEEEKNNLDEPVVCAPTGVADLPSFDELDNINDDKLFVDSTTIITAAPVETNVHEPKQQSSLVTVVETQEQTDRVEIVNNPVKNNENMMYNDNVNSHSILMDEIRNAGGLKKAKLRSVSDRKTNDEMVPVGDGLMADLHRKLAMRRQGISGNNKQNDGGLEGVIYRMASTMLPPSQESESEPDGDDDTENDWDD